ncbi:MAG: di-heme oxidoredictase family protein [Chthoniobacter sp.]
MQSGFGLFTRLGCAECHVPTLMTGPNRIRALDRKPVTLFSDLLLHDMGSLNDGIAQADALPPK